VGRHRGGRRDSACRRHVGSPTSSRVIRPESPLPSQVSGCTRSAIGPLYKESVPGLYLFQEDRNGTICGTPRRIFNSTCAVRLIEPKWGGCGVASRSSKAYLYATTHQIVATIWGRSSAGRAPALQVDKPKRCAFMCFRRWRMSAKARIIRSSPRAQNRRRGPIGVCRSINPSRSAARASD